MPPLRVIADAGLSPGMTVERPVRTKTAQYTTGEIGRLRVVADVLPSPDDLVPREDTVKVTPKQRRSRDGRHPDRHRE